MDLKRILRVPLFCFFHNKIDKIIATSCVINDSFYISPETVEYLLRVRDMKWNNKKVLSTKVRKTSLSLMFIHQKKYVSL